jgi:hypothetical protein
MTRAPRTRKLNAPQTPLLSHQVVEEPGKVAVAEPDEPAEVPEADAIPDVEPRALHQIQNLRVSIRP